MSLHLLSHPILTCSEAKSFEHLLLAGNEEAEWQAMTRAGEGVADSFLRDMRELRSIPQGPRFLALIGKGHNGGDALVVMRRLMKSIPTIRACIWPLEPWDSCRPNVRRARDELLEVASARITEMEPASVLESKEHMKAALDQVCSKRGFTGCVDGLLGMQCKPPLRKPAALVINLVNGRSDLGTRMSVDLPSGIADESDSSPFRADFTYAAGIAKAPLLDPANAPSTGRIRYVDIGFFDGAARPETSSLSEEILPIAALRALRRLRPPSCDKRDFGHLFLIAGSRTFPGAALMAAKAAARSGVGLLTVFVPQSLHAAFAAALPEAMWVPMPETRFGGLSLEGRALVAQRLPGATALAAGPGLGNERESHVLLSETLRGFDRPVVLDADALQPDVIGQVTSRDKLVVTPHAGEFARIIGNQDLSPQAYSRVHSCVTVLKGPLTRICSGDRQLVNVSGGPVLARGGSGDLLTGIIGSLLARYPENTLAAASLGVLWHARAADALARQHGQEGVTITEILDYLSFSLRNDY